MKKNNFKLRNSYAGNYIFINRQSNKKIKENSIDKKEIHKVLGYTASLSVFMAIVAVSIYLGNISQKNYNKKLDEELSTSEIKEASILEINKDSMDKFIKIDTNDSGKFDNGDNFISGIYRFELPNEAETIVFLDNISGSKPLAYSTENKEYVLIKKPSEYYNHNKKAEDFDKDFENFIINKKIIKNR